MEIENAVNQAQKEPAQIAAATVLKMVQKIKEADHPDKTRDRRACGQAGDGFHSGHEVKGDYPNPGGSGAGHGEEQG